MQIMFRCAQARHMIPPVLGLSGARTIFAFLKHFVRPITWRHGEPGKGSRHKRASPKRHRKLSSGLVTGRRQRKYNTDMNNRDTQ
jgi:hypothetical protein